MQCPLESIRHGFIFHYNNDPKQTAVKDTRIGKPTMEHYRLRTGIPKSWTSILLKEFGIVLIKTKEKAASFQRRTSNVPEEAWRTVPEDDLEKLQESLPKRVQVVFENKGGHTKYEF